MNREFSTKRQTLPSFGSNPSRRPLVHDQQRSNLFTDKNYNQTNLVGSPTHNALFSTLNQIGKMNSPNFYSSQRAGGFLGFKGVNNRENLESGNYASIGQNLEIKLQRGRLSSRPRDNGTNPKRSENTLKNIQKSLYFLG